MMNYLLAALMLVGVGAMKLKSTAVCLGVTNSLGCFPTGYPWYIPLLRPMPPPQTPEAIDTQFYLYTRAQPASFKVVKQPLSLNGSTFNGTKPTFFVIQGFKSNMTRTWVHELKDALLKEFDGNVFLVDWSKGSSFDSYFQAASNARIAAAELKRLASYLVCKRNSAVSRMHFIGHSLGAHIAGYVGKEMPGIARISALDAAQPAFEGFPPEVHLTFNDAVFVEAIHTNARPFIPSIGLGYMGPLGHVDFYVNGGAMQPGCLNPMATPTTLLQLLNTTTEVFLQTSVCPHTRAHDLFIASVANKNNIMWGHKTTYPLPTISATFPPCTKVTCSPLGLQTTNYPARGVFLVNTNATTPYFIKEATSDTIMAPFKLGVSAPL